MSPSSRVDPPADPLTDPLTDLAARVGRLPAPVLLLVDDSDPEADAWRRLPIDGRVLPLSELVESIAGRSATLLLIVRDRAALRRAVSGLARVGQVRTVACWLAEAAAPLTFVPAADLPPLEGLRSELVPGGGALLVARFSGRVPAVPVLADIGRQAVPGVDTGGGGLVVGRVRGDSRPVPAGLDLGVVVVTDPTAAGGEQLVVPPDLVLYDGIDPRSVPAGVRAGVRAGIQAGIQAGIPEHPVLGRSPVLVTDAGFEPVDEMVVNPIGYRRTWSEPVVDLRADARIEGGRSDRLDLSRGVTERHVRELRGVQGVRVGWPRLRGRSRVENVARALVGLACAGVPLVVAEPPAAAVDLLGPELAAALAGPVDLDDPLARDERSVSARRAALDTRSTLAWRGGLADRVGVRFRSLPSVTVVCATRRPEMLDFALRQIARQRGADLELVLAAHGFAPDPAACRAALPGRDVQVLSFPADTPFGDVLTGGVRAGSGEVVLKVDDDDWYAPDAVHDLLLARHYSGADLVGMPAEFVYLAELDATVRRNHPHEVYNRFVAGGTLMIDRGLLREVGDFRSVRRYVDAQLLAAVRAAGGQLYRTHGLGYVLRREATGHTWSQDPEHFRDPDALETEWPGFHPSALMEVDPRDRPGGGG